MSLVPCTAERLAHTAKGLQLLPIIKGVQKRLQFLNLIIELKMELCVDTWKRLNTFHVFNLVLNVLTIQQDIQRQPAVRPTQRSATQPAQPREEPRPTRAQPRHSTWKPPHRHNMHAHTASDFCATRSANGPGRARLKQRNEWWLVTKDGSRH